MNRRGRPQKTAGFGVIEPSLTTCPRCNGIGQVTSKATSIGGRFRQCRVGMGKTQTEIAVFLGMGQSEISDLECDKSRPSVETLVKAADVFGVSTDFLLGRKAAT